MKISVCIATYNGEKYIKEQLDSIIPQLESDDEIIISDDSSTDRTVEIVKSLNDKRIAILENCTFKNPVYNFENAIKHASGDYIFLADQDDIWKKDKVSKCLRELARVDLVLSDCEVVNDDKTIIHNSFFKLNRSSPGLITNVIKNSYMGCCMAFSKKVAHKAIPFPKAIPMHDQWIGLIGEKFFKTEFINDPLILYRRHDSNASPTGFKSNFTLTEKIKNRWNIIKNLIKLSIKQANSN